MRAHVDDGSQGPRLSQGAVIDAEIEAHLLGIRLLSLKAVITALPLARWSRSLGRRRVEDGARGARPGARPETLRSAAAEAVGPQGLAEAARSLASADADLSAARLGRSELRVNGRS